jgi:hypothetical protein
MASPDSVRPLISGASKDRIVAILGAMRSIAETGRGATAADQTAIKGAARYMFGYDGPVDAKAIPAVSPDALVKTLAGSNLAEDAAKFLTIMAMMDAPVDDAKLKAVLAYAGKLGIHARYIDEIAEATQQKLQEALADMTRANLDSVLNHPWQGGDANAWFMPYQGKAADPALVAKFVALKNLDPASFGYHFWAHFTRNGYGFPGDPTGLNADFACRHDSVHVLSGYDTTARGEILASTFTAAMHRRFPMAGHIIPVIFSLHLNVRINNVAGSIEGLLDPTEVWRAYAAGAQCKTDTFAPAWDFWAYVARPIDDLRREWNIPVGGLQPPDAHS